MRDAEIFKYKRLKEYKEPVLAIPAVVSTVALILLYSPVTEKPNLEFFLVSFLFALSIVVAYIDFFYEEIPDYYPLVAAAVAIILFFLDPNHIFNSAAIVLVFYTYFVFAFIPKGFGVGDCKFAIALSFALSFTQNYMFLIIACLGGILTWIIMRATTRMCCRTVPFAPAIAASFILCKLLL